MATFSVEYRIQTPTSYYRTHKALNKRRQNELWHFVYLGCAVGYARNILICFVLNYIIYIYTKLSFRQGPATEASFADAFKFFFSQFLSTTTTTTTTTTASSASGSAGGNYTNSSTIVYNQNLLIQNSTNTSGIGIIPSRLVRSADSDNERFAVSNNILQRVAETEFENIIDCFNKHAAQFLKVVTEAEENMAICVSNRFMEVVNVAKNMLETLEQLDNDGNEKISDEQITFVRDAQRAITALTDDMYYCNQAITDVMTNQSVGATNTFELCTAVHE